MAACGGDWAEACRVLSFGLSLKHDVGAGRADDTRSMLSCRSSLAGMARDQDAVTVGALSCVRLAVYVAFGHQANYRRAVEFFESRRLAGEFWCGVWRRILPAISPPPLVAFLIDSVVYPPVRHFLHRLALAFQRLCDARVVDSAIAESMKTPMCITSDSMHAELVRCICAGRIEACIGNVAEELCAIQYSCCGIKTSYVDHALLLVLLAFSEGAGPVPQNAALLRQSFVDACEDDRYCMRYVFNQWNQEHSVQ